MKCPRAVNDHNARQNHVITIIITLYGIYTMFDYLQISYSFYLACTRKWRAFWSHYWPATFH